MPSSIHKSASVKDIESGEGDEYGTESRYSNAYTEYHQRDVDADKNMGVFSTDSLRQGAWFNMLGTPQEDVPVFVWVSANMTALHTSSTPPPALADVTTTSLSNVTDVQLGDIRDVRGPRTVVVCTDEGNMYMMASSPAVAEEWMHSLQRLAVKARPRDAKVARKRKMKNEMMDILAAPGRCHYGWKLIVAFLGIGMIIAGICILVFNLLG